jgi:hypothetical protein
MQDPALGAAVDDEKQRRDGIDTSQQHCQDGKFIKRSAIQHLYTIQACMSLHVPTQAAC